MTQARFQATSIYPVARAASQVAAARSDAITKKFEDYVSQKIDEDQKRPLLSRKLFGAISTEDFGKALQDLPPLEDPAFSSGVKFIDAWHQFKAFYNDEIETYNKFTSIAKAIVDGHALEITMDVHDFVTMQSYAEHFSEEE